MSGYIHFTQQQKEQARQTDLVDLLQTRGETVERSGSEYVWMDGTAKVCIRGNLWYHQYDQEGGDAIDFVKKFMDKSYPEAVQYLLGGNAGEIRTSPKVERKVDPKKFNKPERNESLRRAYAYLNVRRGIDREVLNAFVHKNMIYESADYHNAVFAGYDLEGNLKHANMRGTGTNSTYKGNATGSMPEYSFHWHGTSEKLFLFEAPVDMLSFISMHKENWQTHSYAACCGVGDRVLFQMLKDNPNIKTVCLCLDSDEAGQTANKRIAAKLKEKGINTEILVPSHKDWNEDLLNPPSEESEEVSEEGEPCRVLQLS